MASHVDGQSISEDPELNKDKVLENKDIRVEFDWEGGTFLPKLIWFKELDITFDVEMLFVRYPASVTDSGAYIMAPRNRAIPLYLDVIDAKIMNADKKDETETYI